MLYIPPQPHVSLRSNLQGTFIQIASGFANRPLARSRSVPSRTATPTENAPKLVAPPQPREPGNAPRHTARATATASVASTLAHQMCLTFIAGFVLFVVKGKHGLKPAVPWWFNFDPYPYEEAHLPHGAVVLPSPLTSGARTRSAALAAYDKR